MISRPALYRTMLLLLSSVAFSFAQQPEHPLAGDPDAVAEGGAAFRPYCTPCHGVRGQGGRGPDLTRGVYSAGEKDADLFRVIASGVAGTEMAGFDGDLNSGEIWRIVAFIRSIARHDAPSLPGNRAAGEKLFWSKGGCGACHVVHSKGGRLGPDLSRIGRERSMAYLRESVLAPDSDVKREYATITAVRRDGTKIIGVGELDNFSVRITDTAGNYYSFLRSDLASVKCELRSLMPGDYGRVFTPSEIDDLVAYLAGLRGEEAR